MCTLMGAWTDDVEAGKVPPIYVGLTFISLSLLTLSYCLISTVPAIKLFCGAWGIHFVLISFVYIETNSHKKYREDAAVWLAWMTRLIMLTSVIVLLNDYSNTKILLHAFIIGSLGSGAHGWLRSRRSRDRR